MKIFIGQLVEDLAGNEEEITRCPLGRQNLSEMLKYNIEERLKNGREWLKVSNELIRQCDEIFK